MTFKIKKTIAFFVMSFIVLSLLFIRLNRDIELKEADTTNPSNYTQYTIREYNGKVAVFENNNTLPENVYDAYTSVLPESDQIRLKRGITVNNKTELQKIIEDYTS